MSLTTIVKMNYNPTNETLDLVISHPRWNVSPTRYTDNGTIAVDPNGIYAYYAVTPYEKVMSSVYVGLIKGMYSFHSTVAKKYRDAYNVVMASFFDEENNPERLPLENEKYFRLFLDTIDGKHKVTPGRFILIDDSNDNNIAYWKTVKSDVYRVENARIFRSREEARVVAHYSKYKMVEVS